MVNQQGRQDHAARLLSEQFIDSHFCTVLVQVSISRTCTKCTLAVVYGRKNL